MINFKRYSLLVVIGFVLLVSTPGHSQFISIARKIKSMHTSEMDVATVILDARTFKVYQTILDTLTSNKNFEITSRDNAKRLVEFKKQSQKVSMQVDSLDNGLSQITVASLHSDNSAKQTTTVAVDAILKVCQAVGIKCTLEKP
jgi:hypothetical protein